MTFAVCYTNDLKPLHVFNKATEAAAWIQGHRSDYKMCVIDSRDGHCAFQPETSERFGRRTGYSTTILNELLQS